MSVLSYFWDMRAALLVLGMMIGLGMYAQNGTVETRADFKKFYDAYGIDGTFAVYSYRNNHTVLYHPEWFTEAHVPASTFKICNSLIGLETGVIADQHFTLKWDGVKRRVESWNQDHDLASAFAHSAYWYYQELARRVGGKSMKQWLDRVGYGNADTTGGIDRFWLEGNLRISPAQQLDFLKRLHENRLPFSQRSIDIVKEIMVVKQTETCTVRAKTGWGFEGRKMIGWYVGYVVSGTDVSVFVNRVESMDEQHKEFGAARVAIAYRILDELGIGTE